MHVRELPPQRPIKSRGDFYGNRDHYQPGGRADRIGCPDTEQPKGNEVGCGSAGEDRHQFNIIEYRNYGYPGGSADHADIHLRSFGEIGQGGGQGGEQYAPAGHAGGQTKGVRRWRDHTERL